MRVLLDAYWWGRGPVSNRQVQREIITHWAELFPEDELVLVVRHDARDEPVPAGVRTVSTRLWPHGIAAIVHYPRLARRVRADVTLTHNFTPWTGRSAVFVHDVMFQTNPEWFTRAERLYLWLVTRTVRRADLVLTSSANEARRIEATNPGVTGVEAVGLAVGTALADAIPRPPVGEDLPERFVLSVGRLNVRKNLDLVFRAALRSGTITPERPLVVVGEPQGLATVVDPDVRAAADAGSIRFLGRIGDAELAWLYRNAELFVFCSLDEGFGLPPLEALHFGCPVLASDIPVMREVLGSAAHFVDPRALESVAAALRALDPPPPLRGEAPAATWEACVRAIRSAVAVAVPA